MEEQKPKSRRRSRSKATKKEEAAPAPQPEKQKPEETNQPEKNDSGVVKIEIQKYKSLIDALGEKKTVFRAILTIFMIGVLLFTGITAVVIAVKRFYPYSDIVTNALGATTLKNEDKVVSYWLLNTADLWANSGIKVKAGQTITVRASGKKHTAMHHLYDDTYLNEAQPSEPWVGTMGFSDKEKKLLQRDLTRAKYKIFPEENQDALLMQIVPEGKSPDMRPKFLEKNKKGEFDFVESTNRFLIVGDRQENIYIDKDGVLFFAINDIVLDDATIIEMMWNISQNNYKDIFEDKVKKSMSQLDTLRANRLEHYKEDPKKNPMDEFRKDNTSYEKFLSACGVNTKKFKPNTTKNGGLSFGDFAFGTTSQTNFIELYGYFMFGYQTPWYDDNLGSFLIVVESSSN